MKTVVINNREGMVVGQLPHKGKDMAGHQKAGGIVVLLPGTNLVDSESLAILRQNAAFELNFTTKIAASPAPEQNAERVGRPILEVVCENLDDDAPLAKLKPAMLQRIVGETFNEDLLKSWLHGEPERPLRKLLESQVAKVSGKPIAAVSP